MQGGSVHRRVRSVRHRIAEDGLHLALKRPTVQRRSSSQRPMDVVRQRPQQQVRHEDFVQGWQRQQYDTVIATGRNSNMAGVVGSIPIK